MPGIRIQPATSADRQTILNLMQLYVYDMGEFVNVRLHAEGLFELDDSIELYWVEPTRYPFVIWADDQLAGFALVRVVADGTFSVAEFFIRRGFRRSGVGAEAAVKLFDRFRGTWKVAQLERNAPAQAFWRRVIGQYTSGRFSEEWSPSSPKGPMQVFSNVEQA